MYSFKQGLNFGLGLHAFPIILLIPIDYQIKLLFWKFSQTESVIDHYHVFPFHENSISMEDQNQRWIIIFCLKIFQNLLDFLYIKFAE